MIKFPFISLPDYFTRLLVSSIQNSTQTNNNLELYINVNKDLNALVKKVFKDIDPDGFLGKIISISGWSGIRNRLAAVFLEHAMTGKFPETANLNLVTDIINVENKLRHFTPSGFNRAFLLAFYAKMTLIDYKLKEASETTTYSPLLIKEEHIEFMKLSKAKSVRIDWLMLELIQFDHFLGTERLQTLLKNETRYTALFSLLSHDEQKLMMSNFITYGASVNDLDIFTSDISIQ
ncbi:MAG: hypothetical protein HOP07_06315 [Bacteriovoracaceae bacterium]|nr:hypothetical protein [Bacteriovoracaceae bacterium]